MNDISIVIGSWGSYNECNERALGSSWLNLSNYSDWGDIETELKNQGFELDGIDEELFIQDVDNFPSASCNWDYMHPEAFFETLQEAGVFDDDYKSSVMSAYLEIYSYDDFKELVNSHGSHWDDDIRLYHNFDWEDYGKEMFEACGYEIDERLLDFFDFEAYGMYIGSEYAHEYSDGIIEIIN